MAALVEEETCLIRPLRDGRNPNYETMDSRRSSVVSQPDPMTGPMSVEELQFRFKYSFLDRGYDAENEVRTVLSTMVGLEKETARERILQDINKTPLGMRNKLDLVRLLKDGTSGRGRSRVKEAKLKKKRGFVQQIHSLHLWEGPIAKISAYFGSNVASYFRFLRTLFYLNTMTAILMVGLITIPQIISGDSNTKRFGGEFGLLSDSIVFYGDYTNRIMDDYNLPVAYLLTWVAVNVGFFVFIIGVMLVRYRQSKIVGMGDEYKFAWKTMCTWDHSITTKDGVKDHFRALNTNMKEIIREERITEVIPLCRRLCFYLGRLVSNLLSLGLLVGSGLLIYLVVKNPYIPDWASSDLVQLLDDYEVTAVVAGLKFIVPPIFFQLVRLEGWIPRVEVKWTLARTTLFYFASQIIFVQSLYADTDDCDFALRNGTDFYETDSEDTKPCCWENKVAEEVFKVILLDLALCIAVGLLFEVGRAAAVKCSCFTKSFGYSTFNVISCVLDLIYGQGLVWLGLFFSPLIAVVAVVKLIVVFYFRYIVARVAMAPAQELFRASSTGNFYLAILLLNLFIVLFPMTYAVLELTPSPDCGPFRMRVRAYTVVGDVIGELPDWVDTGLNYVTNEVVIIPIVLLLILIGIYYKTKSASYANLITELRNQLKFERRVEKRKVFATARTMSAVSLASAKTSMTSLDQIPETPTRSRRPIISDVIEEDETFQMGIGSDSLPRDYIEEQE